VNRWVICCDFDGTICVPDSSDFLLEKFGLPHWKELDDAVWRSEITEREAYAKQIGLLRVTWNKARRALHEGVVIREGFSEFVEFCRKTELPLLILSSGLRELIDELLSKAGIAGIPIHSHRVAIEKDKWTLIPWRGARLADHCSHCKCAYVVAQQKTGAKIVYIGDGFTDICPSQHADILFAAGTLAHECAKSSRNFLPFKTFFDIERKLEELLHIEQDLR